MSLSGRDGRTSRKPVTVLGVSVSNVATAALIRDGVVTACVSEERLNRVKSWSGFPADAIAECLRLAGLEPGDVDRMTLHGYSPWVYGLVGENQPAAGRPWHVGARQAMTGMMAVAPSSAWMYQAARDHLYRPIVHGRWQRERIRFASRASGIPEARIDATDHHRCHAYAGVHATLGRPDGRYLVLTSDGRGDDCSSAVWLYDRGSWRQIARTSNDHSVAYLYLAVTELLGMKGNEHEYKVMGLAPYAAGADAARALALMEDLVSCDGLTFSSRVPAQSYYPVLRKRLERQRFDWIAGAAQLMTERLLTAWTRAAVRETGVRDVVLSGGAFMNVKANMAIGALDEVETLTICPSPSDDSSAIGAAYWAYEQECAARGLDFAPQPLPTLYLGGSYSDGEIAAIVRRFQSTGGAESVAVERVEGAGRIEDRVARLLADGEVVARFAGPMEFGARALGNRSLLANPSLPGVVETLNRQIKSRDFWMPFAGTLLAERTGSYLVNPKEFAAPHMVLTFETTARARRDLAAAMHPVDHTIRPQVLEEAVNPGYYALIKRFEALTGIGGVLNTSFNLHGEPIVRSPEDALRTFAVSGLRHLALGSWLLSKAGSPDSRESVSRPEARETLLPAYELTD